MFHTFFYEPIYNLLAFVLNIVPLHDIGMGIVIVTLIIKGILLPLNLSALRTQYMMKKVEGEMKKIKELQKTKPQEASRQMLDLYRKEKIKPFSSFFGMILQVFVFFALYSVFSKGFTNDPASLYSFVSFPESLHTIAFGLFDVTERNIIIAILAGIAQYILAKRQTVDMVSPKKEGEETFQDQLMKSMKVQILYVLPIIIVVSGAFLPAALPLYWFVSSIINYGLDVYMKNKLAHLKPIH